MLTELTPEIIDSMLVNQYYGRIACSAYGRVLIEPVMYCYEGYYIYGLTREGTKTQLLRTNPSVGFEIDEMISATTWQSVVIEGIYEELKGDELDYALHLLKRHKIPIFSDEKLSYPGEKPPTTGRSIYPVIYRIRIQSKTGRRYQLQNQTLENQPTLV